ncbi:hypothetical protein [Novosphingobium sp. LASN5T]|uniref:hypothetical protein n=1 Tax=unclassified Novosphingobium TaxID=2644732 RepID=UPI000F5E2F41|nr:hypothetical protein [Novosphingobium sp. LASN5T]RQW43283.1 hypothetical protein EH199_13655 [Novosphingobium sp. LASN5T]
MPFRSILKYVLVLAPALLLPATPAFAAPEEIQVYMDEMNQPGAVGLDVHVNDVVRGNGTPDYPGAETPLHRWRITPEFSLGLTDQFELGAYLPLATVAPDGVARVQGVKLRLKWLAPHGPTGAFWGANLEVGKVGHRLDQNPWNGELKLIGGWRNDHWVLAANGNFDFVIAGPNPGPITLDIDTKAGYRLTPTLTVGVESYNEVGPLRDPGHFGNTEHSTYAAVDAQIGKWDLNAAVGKGYGANADSVIVKFIIGVPI